MKACFLFLTLLVLQLITVDAQDLRLDPRLKLTSDSLKNKQLVDDLNGFLKAAQLPNDHNTYVHEGNKLSTYILIDELKGITVSRSLNDTAFYQPYLTNVIPIDSVHYMIQLAYIGVDNNKAHLRALFELIAQDTAGSFLFTSPMEYHTANWKKVISQTTTFYYQDSINLQNVTDYTNYLKAFNKKLNAPATKTTFYCFPNNVALQKVCGVVYKADYNGRKEGVWYSRSGNDKLVLLGNDNAHFNKFDPHDLWHSELSNIISRRKVNKSVDEGCAYLYGGSWGYSWDTILQHFKEEIVSKGHTDWLALKEKPVYFKTGRYSNSADYIVNALLVKKIEAEKGFSAVWELLTTGPAEKDHLSYYQKLEALTGISRENYNKQIDALIAAER